MTQILCNWSTLPGDFITKVKQVNSQSDLISMSSFAGPSYLTIRSFVCIILIWDPCICNLCNLCQTGSNFTLQKPHQCALNFTGQMTRAHFLLLQPSIRTFPAQIILLWKGPPKLCIESHLVPLERSRQNHLVTSLSDLLLISFNSDPFYLSRAFLLNISKTVRLIFIKLCDF